uniref:Secreted protein n=1 Tax=Pristhesancus plagipennis TaxID=1955184 RepID=A0A2K8JMD1_PRIPG|nr:secreted hypothetical protein [Pristhesancus plagipennis]
MAAYLASLLWALRLVQSFNTDQCSQVVNCHIIDSFFGLFSYQATCRNHLWKLRGGGNLKIQDAALPEVMPKRRFREG